MKTSDSQYIIQALNWLQYGVNVKRATKYVSKDKIIRATLHKESIDKRNHIFKVVLTIGKPNYIERQFIKDCIKVGQRFPVKGIQLKHYKPKK